MINELLKNILSELGTTGLRLLTNIVIPNQTLPAENTLVSKFVYGQQTGKTFNNAVRIAEVSDGLIIKVPVMNAMKVPFSVMQHVATTESGSKTTISILFHRDGIGTIDMTIPTEAIGQFPMLLSQKDQMIAPFETPSQTHKPAQEKHVDESDLWTIPKAKTVTQKNAPIRLKDWNIWEKVRAGIVIWMFIEIFSYLSRSF